MTLLQRMKRVFKTDEDAFNFFLENVEVKFRCNLCRKPQTTVRFRCCGGNQNVYQDHRFVIDGERNRISRMPFTKTLATFYFCYHLYLLFGDNFKKKINFYSFHTFAGNFYKTTFRFKEKKFKKLNPSDFKNYNRMFEKLAEKLNAETLN
jgi:hypothetical protein